MTQERYDPLTLVLHWLTVALVLTLWSIAQLWDWLPRGSAPRHAAQALHVSLGLVFILVLATRLLWRATAGRRLAPPPGPRSLVLAARAMHGALYLLLVAMAISGPLNRSAGGDPLGFFGLFTLPPLLAKDKALAESINDVHGTIATIILILAGLHAAAALAHHYLWRDGVLARMLPGRAPHDGAAAAPLSPGGP
jgi:cytochrome b561